MAGGMALIVFLRGINVGGRRLRPSVLAAELRAYDVVNIGAAGTFIVRKPGSSAARFCAELRRRLPFDCDIIVCRDRELMRLEDDGPFATLGTRPRIVRFVSVLPKPVRGPSFPIWLPQRREWYVRLISSKGRFVFGEYRRHMKTIGYLGQIDTLYGVRATTRNWNTIRAIVRVLRGPQRKNGRA